MPLDGQALPIAHVDPAIKFSPHLAEMGDFHKPHFLMQCHAGLIGQGNAAQYRRGRVRWQYLDSVAAGNDLAANLFGSLARVDCIDNRLLKHISSRFKLPEAPPGRKFI